MEGWIKIHRQIKDHWIWKSQNRFQWWIDVLMTVNHADTKVLIKGSLIECKRGQSVRSLETWARDWNVSKKTVKDFFMLLQKDSMLVYESIKISTRITVCNYDNYQEVVNVKETNGKRKVNGEETEAAHKQECKEGIKNEKNEKNKEVEDLFDSIIIFFDENCRPNTEALKKEWCDTLDKLIRIDKKDPEQIKQIIKRARMDDFWRTNFLSVLKLRRKDKNQISYYTVFENKFLGNKKINDYEFTEADFEN